MLPAKKLVYVIIKQGNKVPRANPPWGGLVQKKPTLHGERGLRARLVDGRARDARVLAGVQLRGVGDEQRVVVGHAEARLVLQVDGLAVAEPHDLQPQRVVGVRVAAERGRRARRHLVVVRLVRDHCTFWGVQVCLEDIDA